jgi:hypothetical protein
VCGFFFIVGGPDNDLYEILSDLICADIEDASGHGAIFTALAAFLAPEKLVSDGFFEGVGLMYFESFVVGFVLFVQLLGLLEEGVPIGAESVAGSSLG